MGKKAQAAASPPFGGAKVIYAATIQKSRESIKKESIQDEKGLAGQYFEHPVTSEGDDYFEYATASTNYNAYHARCLRVKTDITVGLGLNVISGDESKINDRLAILNEKGESFIEILSRAWQDFETTGEGLIEVVRGKLSDQIAELYFMPSKFFYVRPRGSNTPYYYYNNETGTMREMPAYSPGSKDKNSILRFTNYTQADRFYGLPDWRGCLPDIELDYYATLYNKKFFINSGIPDLAIVVTGGQFDKETQDAVVGFLQSNIKGVNNAHKTLYLPISDKDVEIKFERLGMELPKDASFDNLRSRCRDNIVSAHGVYPRLVGIVTAGQLGGGGEASGQLKTFQEITINPRQALAELKLAPLFNDLGLGKVNVALEKMDTTIQEADSTYFTALVNSGILSKDEAREAMGYVKLPNGEGKNPEEKKDDEDKALLLEDEKKLKPELRLVKALEQIRKAL